MGIGLVVLDEPGSWLADDQDPNVHLRNLLFHSTSIRTRDLRTGSRKSPASFVSMAYFPARKHLLPDPRSMPGTGSSNISPQAVFRRTNKYSQRQLHNDDGSAFRMSGVGDLQRHLNSSDRLPEFHVVMKSCTGGGSQCVSKVSAVEDFVQAVTKIKGRVLGHEGSAPIIADALIESFISGFEIDANLVMQNGKLLFREIADDFPSPADKENSAMAEDFQDTMFGVPSKLPPQKRDAIQASLYESVLRLSLSLGVFHVEARVRNSSIHYSERPDSVVDLVQLQSAPSQKPSCFLLGVNVRPPAYFGLMTAAYTYGVDYFVPFALRALGDAFRFKAMSQPLLQGSSVHKCRHHPFARRAVY